MPEITTATTPETNNTDPAGEETQPTQAVEETAPETASDDAEGSETPEMSDDLESRLALLQEEEFDDGSGETEPEASNETEEYETPAAPAAGKKKPEPVATEDFDSEQFVKMFTDELGDSSKPIAEYISGTIGALTAKVEALLDENKKLRGEFEPVNKRVQGWQQREDAQRQTEARETGRWIHGFLDKQTQYADRLGKGDPDKHTDAQKNWRRKVAMRAGSLIEKAESRGIKLTREEAMQGALRDTFGSPSKTGATNAVQSAVKRAARGISADPGRGGGSKSNQNQFETPEQERARGLAAIRRIENSRK